jgi:hypothetical protein
MDPVMTTSFFLLSTHPASKNAESKAASNLQRKLLNGEDGFSYKIAAEPLLGGFEIFLIFRLFNLYTYFSPDFFPDIQH